MTLFPKSLRVAFFLAYSSVLRANSGVIALTVLILALAGLNLLFVPGLLQGLVDGANAKVKDTYAGSLVVESNTENPLIVDSRALTNSIKSMPGVQSATPRNTLGADLTFGNERTTCVVTGVVPEGERSVFTIDRYMIEGHYLTDGDPGIVLGVQLAGAGQTDIEMYSRSLKRAHAGDVISVTYANGVKKSYKLKGIFKTDFIQTDLQAFVSETEFESVDPIVKGMAGSIRVKTVVEASVSPIAGMITQARGGLRVSPWEDYAGIMRSMTNSFSVINTILNVVNVLVAAITVFIVTYIDVTNRRRQIGIQRAIGITPSSIVMTYVLRATFYAFVAAGVAGLVFLYGVIPLEAKYPFHFPFGPVYLVFGLHSMARAGLILLSASLVASFFPAWLSLRIRIMDAIWG
jgi:putative ABC transport system permease protein